MKKYLMAFLIWVFIIPLAILNAGLRENVLVKLGAVALPLSGVILSCCIFGMAFFTIPKIKNCEKKDYFIFGIMWFILTNLFDLISYIMDGGGFIDLLKSYNIFTGNTWLIVVLTALISPVAVIKIRKKK